MFQSYGKRATGKRALHETGSAGHYTIRVPVDVYAASTSNADRVGVNFTTYLTASHGLLYELTKIGVTKDSRIRGKAGAQPLPKINPTDESRATDLTNRLAVNLRPAFITESTNYRHKHDLSLSHYAARCLRLTNYMFQIATGDPVRLTKQPEGDTYSILTFLHIPSELPEQQSLDPTV